MNKGKRVWWIAVSVWMLLAVLLTVFAPGGNENVIANKDAGLPSDAPSIVAANELKKHFPSDGGIPLFGVFHKDGELSDEEIVGFAQAIESLKEDKAYEECGCHSFIQTQPRAARVISVGK